MNTWEPAMDPWKGARDLTCTSVSFPHFLTFLLRLQKDYEANLKMEDQTEESEAKIKKNICPW